MKPSVEAHGVRARYLAGCRCSSCAKANASWVKAYRYRAAKAGGSTTADAGPARAHIRRLRTSMSFTAIAIASGIDRTTIRCIADGTTKRTRPTTLAALLAVGITTPAGGSYVTARGARRRLQALHAIGWAFDRLEAEIGYSKFNILEVTYNRRDWIKSDTHQRIAAAYDRLCMQLPSSSDHHITAGITKARNRAAKLGWAPPLAWDDIDRDDEPYQETPSRSRHPRTTAPDPVAVQRFLDGDRKVDTSTAERCEITIQWRARGWSLEKLRRETGWAVNRYLRMAQNLPQNAADGPDLSEGLETVSERDNDERRAS